MKGELKTPDNDLALGTRNCTVLSYRITVPVEKFAEREYVEAIGTAPDESRGWKALFRNSGNPRVDYHVHAYWRTHPNNESQLQFQVDFHAFAQELKMEHSAPYAEDFVEWAGKFFQDQNVTAHIHAEFEYPLHEWQTKLMRLPMKVPYEEKEAVIEGLEFKFPSKPEGVQNAWLQVGPKALAIQLFADRSLVFKGFRPHNDLEPFVLVLGTLIEEKKK